MLSILRTLGSPLQHLVEKSGSPMDLTSVEGKLQVLEGSVGTILKVCAQTTFAFSTKSVVVADILCVPAIGNLGGL